LYPESYFIGGFDGKGNFPFFSGDMKVTDISQ